MHSMHNENYTIHYNGDFSQIKYISHKTQEEYEIPPSLFALLYSAVADDLRGQIEDLMDNVINEQNTMGRRNQHYWEEENGKV